jgi:signal transduction histidine kinase/ligand-binding sensor domain-containing protein/DNA-binding response OmpR family regulator
MIIANRLSVICSVVSIFGFSIFPLFAQSIKFNHLTVKDGLSNNIVKTVIQDQAGFMWFATEDGLNRYDGYGFKLFRHNPSDSNSLSDNSVWALTEDKSGNIWIGTKAGILDRYDPLQEKFTHWKIKSKLTEENSINAIYEDGKKNIWIGTYKEGLYKLNPETNTIEHWVANPEDEKSLSHNYVQSIIEDDDSNIIIGTYTGLNKFNPDLPENGFEHFYYNNDNYNSLSGNLIWSLSKSDFYPGIIWICTFNNLTKFDSRKSSFERIEVANPDNFQYGKSVNSVVEEIVNGERILWTASYSGLIRINLSTDHSYRYVQDENNSQSLSSNQINKIIKDKTGVLWLVTENGINYNTSKSTLFNSLVFGNVNYNVASALKKKDITAISKSSDNRIWIGTVNGLYLLDNLKTNPELKKLQPFDGYHIWSIISEDENKLWIGTYGKGLKEFNYLTKKITSRDIENPKLKTLSLYYNKSLLRDSNRNIWVGYWGVGAARINTQTGKSNVWLNEPENPKSISYNDVWVIKEDMLGRIWLGTVGGGLNLFEDENDGIFHHWLQSEDENSLSSNNIYSICEAQNLVAPTNSKTILWIGTSDGLNRFEINNINKSNVYDIKIKNQSYTVKDGLPDNSVNSIVEDENGNLWLGTGSGISFFDINEKTFTNFSSADGINGTMMNPESALRLGDGLILMGSTKGLNIFDPQEIHLSDSKPNLVITDFQIFNKSVDIGKNSPLKESISTAKEIILSPDQNVFSFEFASLDFNSSESIEYAYKMEGFDKDWIESGKRRFVTYTNLDPGKYEFKVKSTNADGVWIDNITSLRIVMKPPWWKTLWAYGLYIVLIFFGLVGIRRFELNRTKLRNELKLREFEVRKKSELEEVKSRFFANLSHEFRTPLMLIKGPVEQLKAGKTDEKFLSNINLIEKNSERLKGLIDQLLELSQLEKAAIPLRAAKENLITILKGLTASFESFASQKNISLEFKSDSKEKICWIDRDKLEKIINNLLSNALKFTPDNGKVEVIVKNSSEDEKLFTKIIIKDNGVGIPKEKIDKVFDRFFQVDDSTQRSYGGSGIGLALVKEFVDLHKWKISVTSEFGEGTEFIIQIPMWDDYLTEAEKVQSEETITDTETIRSTGENISSSTGKIQKTKVVTESDNKASILVVDDSEDVRKYLKGLLENDYLVTEAENGIEGIKIAKENISDIIISDVMMPSMDGLEFCSRIKSEWQTSDIPVILLTAKASPESKLEGLEIGADDYLTKPFNSKELFTRIRNLLEQRNRIRDKYKNEPDKIVGTNKLNKADNEFLERTLALVKENLDKTNFGTEQLAKELFVSRTQLHRKLISITGQPPGELIRNKKLKQAAKLLLEGRLSVTQIAYEIGFSSPAQFTRAFTKQFNCIPSEYSLKNKA